ncbi:hypothetical protein ES708_24433 [subsurface metagenome]
MRLAILERPGYRAAVADLFVTAVDAVAFLSDMFTKGFLRLFILVNNVVVSILYGDAVFQGIYHRLQLVLLGLELLFSLLALGDIPGNLKAGDYLSPGVSNGISRGLPEGNLPRRR